MRDDGGVPRAGEDEHLEILRRCEELVPVLAAEAPRAESLRSLTPTVMESATGADLFRVVAPSRWGGDGMGLDTLTGATRILAHGCPASAWTLSFLMLHNWFLTRFPEETQAEAFAHRPFTHVAAPLSPSGTATTVDGGYRISGRWEWATGVNQAEWVMVHALDTAAMEAGTGTTRFALLPIGEVHIEDMWFTSGMRATGSNAVEVTDLEVPATRTTPGEVMLEPASGDDGDGLDPLPVMAVLALVAAAPALGAAEAAVELFRERMRGRVLAYTLGDRQADQPAARVRLAAAMAELRAARAVFDRAVAELVATGSPDAASTGGGPGLSDRAAARLAAATTVRMARSVISTVCEGSGASVYAESSPLQRLQRDVEVLKGHVVFDWDRTTELVGRVALDMQLGPTDLL